MVKAYNNSDSGGIPNDWIITSISDLTPRNRQYSIVDGPFGSNLKTIHYRKTGIPVIASGFVTSGVFAAKDYLYVDIEKFRQEKRSSVSAGDIVMAKIGERCGASAILPENHPEGILSGNALKITIDEKKYSKELISQILWQHHIHGKLEALRTTGAQPALSLASLKKYKILLPPTKAEQTAIAATLSDTDALITSLEHLIAKKKAIKQGATQELLRPTTEWRWIALNQIGKTYGGLSGKSKSDFSGGNYPYIPFMNIMSNTIINTSYLDYVKITPGEKQNKAIKGNLFFNGSSETPEEVGMCAVLLDSIPELYLNSFCFGFRLFDESKTDGLYLAHFFRSNYGRRLFFSLAQGTTRHNLSKANFLQLEFQIPDIEEQRNIACILQEMDAEIALLERKLEKQRLIKQGMMQVLLTGKIRLI